MMAKYRWPPSLRKPTVSTFRQKIMTFENQKIISIFGHGDTKDWINHDLSS
jgi:hypothetical protein